MDKKEFYARGSENGGHFQTLESHLLETAELAEVFGNDFGFGELSCLAALLHDAGKATSDWQKYLLDSIAGKVKNKKDHATAGAKILQEKSIKKSSLAVTAIQAAVMFHHGSGLPDMISPEGSSEFLNRLCKDLAETEISEIKSNIGDSVKGRIEKCIESDTWKNDGREVLLDSCKKGCASKKHLFFNLGLHLRNFSSCLIDADRTDSAAFENDEKITSDKKIPDWGDLLSRLERRLGSFSTEGKLGKIRSDVSERCAELGRGEKGIFTCSAFTGAGKTLASLRFALEQAKKFEMKRIVIVAPYTSIIDQNADEIRSILEDEETRGKIVLECHSNITAEKKESLLDTVADYERYESTWNTPVIVTTMVQFLETLFGSGTKNIRRMHRLASSVLVFDEIQTLPVKTTYLFNWGLEYLVKCCGCSAMLCTATQPCLDRIGDDASFHLKFDGEVIEDVSYHFSSLKRVQFVDKTEGGRKKVSSENVCDYIVSQMESCGSFLAVVNTKSQAKELFELVKSSGSADFVYHLSTNMCPAHRRASIKKMKENLKNGFRVVCVSTRLIEAGVDVSFDGALRYLAGLDSIIQTAGRCNRNGELSDADGNKICGTLAIFAAEDENLGSLEELKIAQSCMERVLREFFKNSSDGNCDLIQPEIISAYFKYFYGAMPKNLLEYCVKGKESTVLDMLSDNPYAICEYNRVNPNRNWKNLFYPQSFKTAWENFEVIADETAGVIVSYGENDVAGRLSALEKHEEHFSEKLRALLREAQQYSVNFYPNQICQFKEKNMIYEILPETGIYAFFGGFYSDDTGFCYDGETFCESPQIF